MTSFDNAPKPEGWEAQAGKHCGQICLDRECPVCGVTLPKLAVLGEN